MRIPAAVRSKAKKIELLLLDVDGVLTDGAIVIDDGGNESKHFHVRDGQGIALLKRTGIDVGFITGRRSKVVRSRARELGVKLIYQGVGNKATVYKQIKAKTGLRDDQIAYAGDDLPDLAILGKTGLAITVPEAGPELSDVADYVTQARGGRGAVREIAELLLKAQGRWQQVIDGYVK
jgi:3-deoxy-D-manno-octulosonate 8-phosphate phosphatase (KDO 8-P phosphatase)